MTALVGESVLDEQPADEEGGVKESEPAQEEATAEATPAEEEPIAEATPAEEEPTAEATPAEEEPTAEAIPAEEEPTAEATPAKEEPTAEAPPAEEEPTAETTPTTTEKKPPAKRSKAKKKKAASAAPAAVKPTAEAAPAEEEAPVSAAPSEEEPAAATPKAPSEDKLFRKGRDWYVVHTYSGYEDKVCTNLEHRIKSMDAEDLVFRVIVPTVEEMEIRDGQRKAVPRKIFPGYVLVEMITLQQEDAKASADDMARSNKAWMVVRNSPGVTGFVGLGTHPTPLEHDEVQSIMQQMRAEEPVVKVGFTVGQSVRVSDGPFADFVGTVDEINPEKGKVKVLVSFFGRETPVELDFLQVERL